MESRPNIVLIGFMGTGKSTVGRHLASGLGMQFVDMDDYISVHAGKSIPAIFAEDGEPAFRALERQAVVELSGRRGQVVATGGGVVLNPANVENFSVSGLLVCLNASVEEILSRLEGDTGRPLLNASDKEAKARDLLNARTHLYAAIPFQIDTDLLDAVDVTEQIMHEYARFCL